MRWTGGLSKAEREARDERLLAALAQASQGGREWVTADVVERALGPDHRALAPHHRMSVQGIGQVLARMARDGRCRQRVDFISAYKSNEGTS